VQKAARYFQHKSIYLKTGKRIGNKQLSFAMLENDLDHARLGVTLAKRFIKRAVHRNQIKRQIRESFRLHPNLANVDIVVQTRKTTDLKDLKKIRAAADELFQRLQN